MDEKLKPCPFCGSAKLKIEYKSQYAGRNGLDCRVEMHTYSVRCNVCHARGGSSGGRVINDPWTHCVPLPDWATTDEALKERATEAWNRRTDPVVHGRWIYKHRHRGGIRIYEGKDEMGETRRISVDERYEIDDPYCSECGKLNESVWLNYCPNCGAKMDGEPCTTQ